MSGGGRLPASASIGYPVNGGIVVDSAGLVIGQNSVITYRNLNDGQPQPDWRGTWGYGQQQTDPGASSILSNHVLIQPGLGSQKPVTTFNFTTMLIQDPFHEEGEPKPPPIYTFNAGDGTIVGNTLTPNGLEGQGVTIQLVPKDADGPATWFIRLETPWFSETTAVGTLRFSVTFELLGEVNSSVFTRKAIEAGAKVYTYPRRVKTLPVRK